mmetsp:Transcript_25744/g.83149  ORF Transcript_25744/g.83149 Transcript_25744/m.83149 type:complete len:183 (+) Transcript_25744:105-653(+)|eukprot:scaffold4836_cov127-Isochrysis_galbana.AAC.5
MLVQVLLAGAPAAARCCTLPVRLPLHAGAQAFLCRHGPVVAVFGDEEDEYQDIFEDGGAEASAQDAAPDRPNPGAQSDLNLDFQRQRLNLLAGLKPLADRDDLDGEKADEAGSEAAVWEAELGVLTARTMIIQVAADKERLEAELNNVVKLRNLHDVIGALLLAAGLLLLQVNVHDGGWLGI